MLFTKRWSFITNEESVVAILKVLNYESGIFRYDLALDAADGLMSVSYTHLDVYKRQAHGF